MTLSSVDVLVHWPEGENQIVEDLSKLVSLGQACDLEIPEVMWKKSKLKVASTEEVARQRLGKMLLVRDFVLKCIGIVQSYVMPRLLLLFVL